MVAWKILDRVGDGLNEITLAGTVAAVGAQHQDLRLIVAIKIERSGRDLVVRQHFAAAVIQGLLPLAKLANGFKHRDQRGFVSRLPADQ